MPHRAVSIECPTYPTSMACPIRVRYSAVPGTFTGVDFASGCCDCHLVQVQPTPDREAMEIHFTGCRNMADLRQALDLRDVEGENGLLAPFACEFRHAGLFVGVVPGFLDEGALMTRLCRIGRPVEFVGGDRPRLQGELFAPERDLESIEA
jgi:hypothetical protein